MSLPDVLSFTTGLRDIPPLENEGIIIRYQRNLDAKVFPLACFNVVKLPVYHPDKDAFFQNG